MLERKNLVYESENLEIINPTGSHIKQIRERINEAKQDENYSDNMLTKILMEELIFVKNDDYDFSQYTLDEIDQLLDEDFYTQYEEMPDIIFHLSTILSDIIISEYRETFLELKKVELDLVQGELSESINTISERVKIIEDAKKNIDEEKRIRDIKKTRKWYKDKENGR